MGILLWLLMGLIVGSVTGFLMRSSYPWYIDVLLGVVGAAVGGWLSTIFLGINLAAGFTLTSFITAIIGAVLVVTVVRFVSRGRSSL